MTDLGENCHPHEVGDPDLTPQGRIRGMLSLGVYKRNAS